MSDNQSRSIVLYQLIESIFIGENPCKEQDLENCYQREWYNENDQIQDK